MNSFSALPGASAMVLAIASTVYAQQPAASSAAPAPASKPAPSAGLLNDWLRQQSPAAKAWDLGGQFRLRYELRDNGGNDGGFANQDFRRVPATFNDNSVLFLREKVHLGFTPAPWLGLYVEGRDARSTNDKRASQPGSDTFDLHQAHVTLGDPKQFPLTAKIGRQEFIYGDERLIGGGDWGNLGRSFDAAKLRFENQDAWVDAFVGRLVMPVDHRFNMPNDYDLFSGVYASTKTLIPKQETQLYFLARNVGQKGSLAEPGWIPGPPRPEDIYTIGARVKSLPGQFKGWDYTAEIAGQFGNMQAPGSATRLDHQALAGTIGGGYTFTDTFGSPRIGLEYNYASGDSNPADGQSGTFENLFPTNHKFYGYMDFIGWRNIHNPRLSLSLKPARQLLVTLDFHLFWLADTADAFYPEAGPGRATPGSAPNAGTGYARSPGNGSFVGSEIDLDVTYTLKPWAVLRGGYGHFFAGDYVKDSLRNVGGATDADWLYVQATVNF